MRYRYEIDENNAVRIWDDENPNENGAPFLYQPEFPDGTQWGNRENAEEWANTFIVDLLAPEPEETTE
jgi:hypothetical protein